MVKQGTNNFVAQKLPPNPKEVAYWIDLTENQIGRSIKVFDGNAWVNLFEQQELPIIDMNSKADKASTLNGYGIVDAYTKAEIHNMLHNL